MLMFCNSIFWGSLICIILLDGIDDLITEERAKTKAVEEERDALLAKLEEMNKPKTRKKKEA